MSKQLNAALEINNPTESVVSEKVTDTIIEDYQKLNEKIDKVISKIKGRKEKKKK
jgi:hypothetical protein